MRLPDIALPGALALATLLVSFQNSAAESGVNKHIINGASAKKIDFPCMAHIKVGNGNGTVFTCGGAIISSKWILTAAHCHMGYKPLRVYLGSVDFRGNDADVVVNKDGFNTFITHENYSAVTRLYDIALIKLKKDLTWTDNIKPVKLPTRSQPLLGAGTQVTASGHGLIFEPGNLKHIFLQYLQFDLRDDELCSRLLLLCSVIHSDRGVNQGDSGGPWLWEDPSGVKRVVGVTNGHNGTLAGQNRTSIAADVHCHLDWISAKTGIQIED